DQREPGRGRRAARDEPAPRQARIDARTEPRGGVQRESDDRRQQNRCKREPGEVAELAGDRAVEPRLEQPVVDHEQHDRCKRDGMQRLADGQRRRLGMIDPAQRSPQPLHSYTVPVVSESGKQTESSAQLAAAEQQAKARFEKAMTELREGAYRFSSRARGQSELIIEELIDPEGDTVRSIAEVEGDQGAVALAQSLELITFDTWLFGQVGDKEELDLKAEEHWEVWFSFGSWIGETIRRRHGGHWLMMGDDPHTWRVGFSKLFLEIAPFVFAEQLLRMGSAATRKMVTEIERIRQLHEPDP